MQWEKIQSVENDMIDFGLMTDWNSLTATGSWKTLA
jgi:hypothetical protein